MSWLVFTGAGISKESGIPTFEELGDLRTKLSRRHFRSNPKELFNILHQIRGKALAAEPNAAHMAIAKSNLKVITMNIDGLHQRAGSTAVLEIHGNLQRVNCPKCQKSYDFKTIETSIFSACCDSVLEPQVVLYDDALKDLEVGYHMLAASAGLLIVGTSFYTSTANYFHDFALSLDLPVHIINQSASTQVPAFLSKLSKAEDSY